MKVGLIGLPQSGKTTLFYALTRGEGSPAGRRQQRARQRRPRPGPALRLRHRSVPPQEAHARHHRVHGRRGADHGGRRRGRRRSSAATSSSASAPWTRSCWSSAPSRRPSLPPPDGGLNPLREYQAITEELLLGDLQVIETRLERIEKQLKTRKAGTPSPEVAEREILLKIKAALDEFQPVSSVELTEDERKIIKNFDFLTGKPLIAVANVGEGDIAEGEDAGPARAAARAVRRRKAIAFIALCAAAEAEVAQLAEDDQREFLDALGIAEPARDRLIRAAYAALGVMSFFTVGEDEVRAWTIPAGAQRPDGGGPHPLRPGARLHPRRSAGLRRSDRRRDLGRRQSRQQAAPGRQRVPRQRRRHPARPIQGITRNGTDDCTCLGPFMNLASDCITMDNSVRFAGALRTFASERPH